MSLYRNIAALGYSDIREGMGGRNERSDGTIGQSNRINGAWTHPFVITESES